MSDERGFTLVEALVAFAILAMTLVALYGAIGTSLSGLSQSARYEEAVLIAEARLAELSAVRALPQTLEGAVEGSRHRWRLEVIAPPNTEPPQLSLSPLRPQKIKLTILWDERGSTRQITVERQLLLWRQAR